MHCLHSTNERDSTACLRGLAAVLALLRPFPSMTAPPLLRYARCAGTRSVSMVFRAVVFTFLPTAVELVLVCGLLARTFTPLVSALVVGTFALYVGWTASLTRAAAEVPP